MCYDLGYCVRANAKEGARTEEKEGGGEEGCVGKGAERFEEAQKGFIGGREVA